MTKKFSDEQKKIIEDGLKIYQKDYPNAKVNIEYKRDQGFRDFKDTEFEYAYITTTISENEWHDKITGEHFIQSRHGHFQEPELDKKDEYYWTRKGWNEKNAPMEGWCMCTREANMLGYYLFEIQKQLNNGNGSFDLLSLSSMLDQKKREQEEFFKEMERMKKEKKLEKLEKEIGDLQSKMCKLKKEIHLKNNEKIDNIKVGDFVAFWDFIEGKMDDKWIEIAKVTDIQSEGFLLGNQGLFNSYLNKNLDK